MKEIYVGLREEAVSKSAVLRKEINLLAIGRLLLFLLFSLGIYFYFTDVEHGIWCIIVSILAYAFLAKHQDRRKERQRLQEELKLINERELAFLDGDVSAFGSGAEYLPKEHAFASDLDLFGNHSLFQFINRASTKLGSFFLAKAFLHPKNEVVDIVDLQKSTIELKPKIAWRQELHALGAVQSHIDDAIKQISGWKLEKETNNRQLTKVLAYLVPALLIVDVVLLLTYRTSIFENLLWVFVTANLILTGRHMKAIKKELVVSAGVSKSLNQCVQLFGHISNAEFTSPKLVHLQNQIGKKSTSAINELATIMAKLESVQNGFGVILMSGTFQYHVHALLELEQWKEQHASEADQWFEVIGEMEALCSLAQFAFNNDQFVFPDFNNEKKMSFEELGHPLIAEKDRVTNSIDFSEGKLVILTGSNMSGKSTFLRTLGINILLAKCGAPVCARAMNIDPIPLFVHMKVSDSLAGGQSYFFAEVDRLKYIKEQLERGPGFVLLDEILRGTNSEDKQIGTMEFLKKLNELNAIGVVATHDLGVCELAKSFPKNMVNKRFEVEIHGQQLLFDYKLQDGICQNKNASVILRQSGII